MINPVTSLGINIAIAVLGVVAGSTTYFTGLFGDHVAGVVVQTAGFTLAIVGAVNGALHAYSSPQPGPMAQK